MRVDDPSANRQTQTRSLRLSCYERIKNLFQKVWRDAVTGIRNSDAKDASTLDHATPDSNSEPTAGSHRFQGVHTEIKEELSQLRSIGFNKWQTVVVSNTQRNASLFHLATKQG